MDDKLNTTEEPESSAYAVRKIMAFLRTPDYFIVQAAIIQLESHTATLRIEAMANIRDVLDHLVRAAQPNVQNEQVDHQISEAREHLRRALSYPYQDEIEERLEQLETTARAYPIRREFFPDIPTEKHFWQELSRAKELLAKARGLKGDHTKIEMTAQLLQSCLTVLDTLAIETRAPRRSPKLQILIFVLLFLGVVGAGLLIVLLFVIVISGLRALFQ